MAADGSGSVGSASLGAAVKPYEWGGFIMDPATYAEIGPELRVAAREGLGVKDSQNTTWFVVRSIKGTFAGLIAVYFVSPTKARVKTVYVRPDFRGLGIGEAMTDNAIDFAKSQGAATLEAIARNPSFYHARGWKTVRTRKNGSEVVIWNANN